MHFDATLEHVVKRMMLERRQIEIAVEFVVDARQQIQVKRSGDALRVVVSGVQACWIFFQIDSHQHGTAGSRQRVRVTQESQRIGSREVADSRTGEINHPPPRCDAVNRRETHGPRIIRAHRRHFHPGIGCRQLCRALLQSGA